MTDPRHIDPGSLLLHSFEMLDDASTASVREHLEGCPACRELLASSVALLDTDESGHIPASIIARWDRARMQLRGLERAIVRLHLERCPECRQDLEVLGQVPELPRIAELEIKGSIDEMLVPLADDSVAGEPGTARPDQDPRPVIRILQAPPNSRREGMLAVWAMAASLIAVAGWLFPWLSSSGLGARGSQVAFEVVRPPRELESPSSGHRAPVTRLTVPPGQKDLQVALNSVPKGGRVQIEVYSPNGERIGLDRVVGGDLRSGDILTMRGIRELRPGPYLLRLRSTAPDSSGADSGAAHIIDYPLELARPGPSTTPGAKDAKGDRP